MQIWTHTDLNSHFKDTTSTATGNNNNNGPINASEFRRPEP
ncbi:hypothetical protein R0I01_11665 [Bacillus pumilus]|nr:hypothetical protein R0I01_11665 [Bacillus pumilus]